MKQSWGPTENGKVYTSTPDWILTVDGHEISLVVSGVDVSFLDINYALDIKFALGTFWASVKVKTAEGQELHLDGIPNIDSLVMKRHIGTAVEAQKAIKAQEIENTEARAKKMVAEFDDVLPPAVKWSKQAQQKLKRSLIRNGWVTTEVVAGLHMSAPTDFTSLLSEDVVRKHIKGQPRSVQTLVSFLSRDLNTFSSELNTRQFNHALESEKEFFDTVEKSPLTQEQVEAVVCFDNRVLLVASAGSGKTSVMVAKAGYAIKKGYCAADRMLLLAFNNDAAAELRQRLKDRLEPLELSAEKIVAKTFHAFGLDVIGQATGKKPSLAPWLDASKDLEVLLGLIDDLKDRDALFRTQWDLFRIVLGQDLPKFGEESKSPDSWNRENNREGFWTLKGEVVKSRGELYIANWFYYNGVEYVYEGPYKVETADAVHRQYRPDFYLPTIDAYLEHWAIDHSGDPPPDFVGYKDSMIWKKELHSQNGTTLLETTMAQLWSGQAFIHLECELTKRGVVLAPNPDRPVTGRKPIENPRLARTFRSFLTHTKSNRLTQADLCMRLNDGMAGMFQFRHSIFLQLFEKIWNSWEGKLRNDGCIDFEDMLNQAIDLIEQGRWKSPYKLVMVDEFQDASHARARLIAGLVKKPGRHLFAVGDDWQSINRFAGADLGVMTDFEVIFGASKTLRLETTFRCPQSLCDISSQFVQKNPKQLAKSVKSFRPDVSNPVRIVLVNDDSKIQLAIAERIEALVAGAEAVGKSNISIYILGRYQTDKQFVPSTAGASKTVKVKFITVHSSKGLEADHVILPRVTSEMLGFPSRVADDPVLQLAMPSGDGFEYAEERRLFYVALTRAKTTVTLITVARKESPFIIELMKEHQLEAVAVDGQKSSSQPCPKCGDGFLVLRTSKYGPFLGCSKYPQCRHTFDQSRG